MAAESSHAAGIWFLVANRLQATQIFQIMKKQLYLTKKNLFGKRITDIETTK